MIIKRDQVLLVLPRSHKVGVEGLRIWGRYWRSLPWLVGWGGDLAYAVCMIARCTGYHQLDRKRARGRGDSWVLLKPQPLTHIPIPTARATTEGHWTDDIRTHRAFSNLRLRR